MASKKDIGMFILILTGVMTSIAFLVATANSTTLQTDYQPQTNETVTISGARIVGNQINSSVNFTLVKGYVYSSKSPISSLVVTNGTGGVIASDNYTINTTNGVLTFLNTTYMVTGGGKGNTTLASYLYPDVNYVTDGTSRTVIPLVILFCVVGIVIFVFARVFMAEGIQKLSRFGGGARVST